MFKNTYFSVLNFLSGGKISGLEAYVSELESSVSELVNLRDEDCEKFDGEKTRLEKKLAEAKSLRAYLFREVTHEEMLEFMTQEEASAMKGCGQYFELYEPKIVGKYLSILRNGKSNMEQIERSLHSSGFDLSDEGFEAACQGEEDAWAEIRENQE